MASRWFNLAKDCHMGFASMRNVGVVREKPHVYGKDGEAWETWRTRLRLLHVAESG